MPAATALALVVQQPALLTRDLATNLPLLLAYLDELMEGHLPPEERSGAGRQLVVRHATLGCITAECAQSTVRALAALGYQPEQIRGMVAVFPTLLNRDLTSPLQQQKLEWIRRVSPWSLDDFLLRNPA